MLNAFHNHEKTIKVFSASLRNFEFDCIGDNLTDNERGIGMYQNRFISLFLFLKSGLFDA